MKFLAGDLQESPQKITQNKVIEDFYKNRKSLLDQSLSQFIDATGLTPKFGLELEFYLINEDKSPLKDASLIDGFISILLKEVAINSLNNIYKIEKEQGRGQIEVKMIFGSNSLEICDEIEKIKLISQKIASEKDLLANFAAQPFKDDCGSALQFNISLHENEENIFFKKDEIFNSSIAALLKYTQEMMVFLAPNSQDYLRFDYDINRNLHKIGKYPAPVNLSFGADNRTCAIRIPKVEDSENSQIKYGKRIEYRVAAANADPYIVMKLLLDAILQGINDDLTPENCGFEKIHGNAFDVQYNLKSLF